MSKNPQSIFVTKASGESAPFDEGLLLKSLERAGADHETAARVLRQVKTRMYPGVSTRQIYRWAFNVLKQRGHPLAARYNLKRAIMELGPSGFPFEKYMGEILSHMGYETQVGLIMPGQCVNHEVDVLARKDDTVYMIECKFHNRQGTVSDVKTPLYIQARFKDIEARWLRQPEHKNLAHKGWVVTNTRFTDDAIKYGTCAGLNMTGWDYPNKGGLRDWIDDLGLYPITCLTTLSKDEKQRLLDAKIVLCREITHQEKPLKHAGIEFSKIGKVQEEARKLCKHIDTNE